MLHQGKIEKVFTICCLGKDKLGQKWAWEKGHAKVVFKAEAVLEHDTLPVVTDKEAEIPKHVPRTTSPPPHAPFWWFSPSCSLPSRAKVPERPSLIKVAPGAQWCQQRLHRRQSLLLGIMGELPHRQLKVDTCGGREEPNLLLQRVLGKIQPSVFTD